MNNKSKISRRNFMRLLVAGSAAAFGGYILSEYAPWLDYEEQVGKTWGEKGSSVQMQALIYYATLAANGHNTQPWKFRIRQDSITVLPDFSRRCPAVDPPGSAARRSA